MAGWHHGLDGRESEWTPGVGVGHGGLACCDSWGHRESDTTERLNWTELNWRCLQIINQGWCCVAFQRYPNIISGFFLLYLVVNTVFQDPNISRCKRKWQPTSVLPAWKIPWTEEPGRLQSMGLQRVGYNCAAEHSVSRCLKSVQRPQAPGLEVTIMSKIVPDKKSDLSHFGLIDLRSLRIFQILFNKCGISFFSDSCKHEEHIFATFYYKTFTFLKKESRCLLINCFVDEMIQFIYLVTKKSFLWSVLHSV